MHAQQNIRLQQSTEMTNYHTVILKLQQAKKHILENRWQ